MCPSPNAHSKISLRISAGGPLVIPGPNDSSLDTQNSRSNGQHHSKAAVHRHLIQQSLVNISASSARLLKSIKSRPRTLIIWMKKVCSSASDRVWRRWWTATKSPPTSLKMETVNSSRSLKRYALMERHYNHLLSSKEHGETWNGGERTHVMQGDDFCHHIRLV